MVKKLLGVISSILVSCLLNAQVTGSSFNFDNGSISGWGSSSSLLTESNFNGSILINSNGVGANNKNSFFFFDDIYDLSSSPTLSLSVKSKKGITIRIDLVDGDGHETNETPIIREVRDLTDWNTLSFNFDDFLNEEGGNVVDADKISGILIYINSGGEFFSGDILIDDIRIGDQAIKSIGNGIPGVKLNQLGFEPEAEKIAIVSSSNEVEFDIKDELENVVYTGSLGELEYWSYADDSVRVADFSDFKTRGKYIVAVEGIPASYEFEIKDEPYLDLAKASIKAFYFARASASLEQQYAGVYARAAGHLDDVVLVHNSAADLNRPAGTEISAPKGWYDAGDYNKYVVNSGITTYTLMSLYEHFAPIYDTLDLNLPESSNNIPDLLDEIKWNIDWMLAMQDPNDGGVYFKLTSKNFTGVTLPVGDNSDRYVVQKSTTSALNFAAVMAVAYRVYKPFEVELPGFADTCLLRSYRAYQWALDNPGISYTNPSDITTGPYGDNFYADEFTWAAAELYIASNDDEYYNQISFNLGSGIPNWNTVSGLAFVSLSHHIDGLSSIADKTAILSKLDDFVRGYKGRFNVNRSAYRIPMGTGGEWEFTWGSNAVAANMSLMLLQDYYNTDEELSLRAARANFDYLLGRNPLEYCFVTEFGTKSPQDVHHRPSEADGIDGSQPGFLAGGPNRNSSNEAGCSYSSSLPALEYTDQQCSFSTNEVAINWNAPLAFISGAINAQTIGVSPSVQYFRRGIPVGVKNKLDNSLIEIFPNPSSDQIQIIIPNNLKVISATIKQMDGSMVKELSNYESVKISDLNDGVFILELITNQGSLSKKLSIVR